MNACFAFAQKAIQTNGLTFWTESFGDPKNRPLLLIMGSGTQGLFWHQKFCEQLATKGFFVIRYDNRDVGLSSIVDYQKDPYTVLDMTKDGIAILDAYHLKKAHIVGTSLGGVIAMLMGAHFPERISSLTLMMTTTDLRPAEDALYGKPSSSILSQPKPEFLAWMKNYFSRIPTTLDEKVQQFIEAGRILNGPKVPYDEVLNQQLALQTFMRARDPSSAINHHKAVSVSYDLYKESPSKLKAPTLILHGAQDPILPTDHAEALKQALPHAEYVLIEDMGHSLNAHFYSFIIEKIGEIANRELQKL
jgi:pimeloyl-ACP methyl ester carboxylesterase